MKVYWAFVIVGLIVVGIIYLGSDRLQEKADIHNPDSEVGKAVEEVTGLGQVRNLDWAKNKLSAAEMREIQTAIVLYQTRMGEDPESVKDLVDAGVIPAGAMTDSYGNYYKIRKNARNEYILVSAGTDKVIGTGDDVERPLMGIAAPGEPAQPKPTPTKSLLDLIPKPTPRWGPGQENQDS